MASLTRTWWGEKFLNVLSISMDSGRLARGRSYAGPNRLLTFTIEGTKITATVRGNVNPYFGVYKEPQYKTSVQLKTFSAKDWEQLVALISENAACLSQLLLGEVPNHIEDIFSQKGLELLPKRRDDLISECSCPDYASPCKHVAGVYYKIASLLDRDPLLVFQLRGMDITKLQEKLAQSPLGQALLDQRADQQLPLIYHTQRYTAPQTVSLNNPSLKTFWHGQQALPLVSTQTQAVTSAVLLKKAGDYPAFWTRNNSFISAMEEVYDLMIKKNKGVF
ncbi:SWIM zinc finger family protein [Thiofilum flexile]|uniref:SWIM zinc finger family protein n=1 Tax=Thiofilum flexile TaxID=125627 RepID=UPI00035D190E|nr:SWIM zinc finger family protein [Thiofilum flexile]